MLRTGRQTEFVVAITIKDSGKAGAGPQESAFRPHPTLGFGYRPLWEGRTTSRVRPLSIAGIVAVALVVLGVALAAPLAGLLLAAILVVGSLLATLEDRNFSTVEAAVLGLLHVVAFFVYAL